MDDREYAHLSRLLDGLDQLYDGTCSVEASFTLLTESAAALSNTASGPVVSRGHPAGALVALGSVETGADRRAAVLLATQELRLHVAEVWAEGYAERHR